MGVQITWYAARASGIVAWALAAGSVVWGLALSTRALGRRPRPPWLFDLHRFLGGAALIFTGIHVGAILLDAYVHFSVVNVLVPLTGTWHPVAVAWGIVSLYVLAAVELTSLARRHISTRLWRRVHFASFVLFVTSTVHALTAGTDRHSEAFVLTVLAVCGTVAALTAVRAGSYGRMRRNAALVRAEAPHGYEQGRGRGAAAPRPPFRRPYAPLFELELEFGQWCVVDELPLEEPEFELVELLDFGVGEAALVAASAWPTPTPPSSVPAASVVAMAARRIFRLTVRSHLLPVPGTASPGGPATGDGRRPGSPEKTTPSWHSRWKPS